MMNIIEIKDQQVRDSFIQDNIETYTFLNSRNRWALHEADGHRVLRYWIYSSSKLIGLFLLILHTAKRGTYFLCPHGPLIQSEYNFFEIVWWIKNQLNSIAHQYWAAFIRFAPLLPHTGENNVQFKAQHLQFAPLHAHAEETNILDLTVSEDDLMKNLRKTTRYMITRAIKEWVVVMRSKNENDIADLITMHHQHSRRTNGKLQYGAFSEHFIRDLVKYFGDDCQIFRGTYQGHTECMVMTIRFGAMTAYYIGASDIRHPKFSPAYLTQWSAIMYAQSIWCASYNFRWVPPDDNPKHPLAGVGLFKRWFGWEDRFFVHAHDLIVDKRKYYLTRLIEKYRAWKRWYYYHRIQG